MNTDTEKHDAIFDAHLYNGRITVTNPNTDQHRIYKVATEKWKVRGKKSETKKVRVLKRKVGYDFVSFAKLGDDGSIVLYRKYQDREHEIDASIIFDPEYWAGERGLEYQYETTCRHCGRALTDHDSIKRGIGPVCLGHLGLTDDARRLKGHAGDEERFGELRHALANDDYQLALLCIGYMDSPDYREVGRNCLKTWLAGSKRKAA